MPRHGTHVAQISHQLVRWSDDEHVRRIYRVRWLIATTRFFDQSLYQCPNIVEKDSVSVTNPPLQILVNLDCPSVVLTDLPRHPEISEGECRKWPTDQRCKDRAEKILANEVEKVAHA